MEVKAVIMVSLILGLVVTAVEAKPCGDDNCYKVCIFSGAPQDFCVSGCKCSLSSASGMVENRGSISEYYCKLGCESSVCENIKIDGAGEEGELKQALKHCNNACYEICSKASKLEVDGA